MSVDNSMTLENQSHTFAKACFICGLAAMFYLYEFILQVSPNVMTHSLMHDLSIDAAGVSIVSMFYYISYTPMQLPAGLLYDRFGARVIISLAIGICSLGALLFGMTHGVFLASMGRLLMGAGSAFSFIGALVLIARWFEPKHFAVMAGVVQLLSSIGAILGETPLALASELYGWRQTMIGLGIAGFVIMATMYIFVRDYPEGYAEQKHVKEFDDGHILENLKIVCRSSQNWWIAGFAFCNWIPVLIFAALWGTAYLEQYYQTSAAIASSAVIMVWLGIGVSSPLLGWWSDKIKKRNGPLLFPCVMGLIATLIMLFFNNLPWAVMYILLFFIGFAAGGQSLSFGVVKDINRPKVVGTAIGFNNMAVVFSGMIFQPLVGYLLRLNWDGGMHAGAPVYTIHNFKIAFMIIPVSFIISILIVMFKLKETGCVAHYE